jgi:Protein of unknown function (DUF664)
MIPPMPDPADDEDLPDRQFGWWDMFVHPDEDPRTDGGFRGERATLAGFLRDQRRTLELKCAGLDAEFDGAVPDPEVVAEAPDLGLTGPDGTVLREVLVHMIEEYARHNGHADFLRERIDGRVGQ